MSKDVQPEPGKHSHFMRRIFVEMTLLLGIFLLGFAPMWLRSRDLASRLAEAENQLSLTSIHSALASAAMDPR